MDKFSDSVDKMKSIVSSYQDKEPLSVKTFVADLNYLSRVDDQTRPEYVVTTTDGTSGASYPWPDKDGWIIGDYPPSYPMINPTTPSGTGEQLSFDWVAKDFDIEIDESVLVGVLVDYSKRVIKVNRNTAKKLLAKMIEKLL